MFQYSTIEEALEELRQVLPLTTYEDYADVLLAHRADMLCAEPAIWIQTTWEGGLRPIKTPPYPRSMLDAYRHNLVASLMMATATEKGNYNFQKGDRVLYGGAPLPYATGLLPSLAEEEIHLEFPHQEPVLQDVLNGDAIFHNDGGRTWLPVPPCSARILVGAPDRFAWES